MSNKVHNAVMLPVASLLEHELNANIQDPQTFTELVKDIENNGFDEPLLVVPKSDGSDKYVVISGNHRLKAVRLLSFEEVPCVIEHGLSEDDQKLRMVRRNLLKGELDPAKFTKLVDSIETNYTPDELANLMGFNSVEGFERMYQMEEELSSRQQGAIQAAIAEKETNVIDGIGLIINRLVTEYGDDIPHSFMFLNHGSKVHMMITMNTNLKKTIEATALLASKNGLNINEVLSACIVEGSKAIGLDGKPNLSKIESLKSVSEDYDFKAVTVRK